MVTAIIDAWGHSWQGAENVRAPDNFMPGHLAKTPDAEHAVINLLDQYVAAYNAHDIGKIADFLSDDALVHTRLKGTHLSKSERLIALDQLFKSDIAIAYEDVLLKREHFGEMHTLGTLWVRRGGSRKAALYRICMRNEGVDWKIVRTDYL